MSMPGGGSTPCRGPNRSLFLLDAAADLSSSIELTPGAAATVYRFDRASHWIRPRQVTDVRGSSSSSATSSARFAPKITP